MTYDSTNGIARLYYGTEASPAKLLLAKTIGAGTNLNFSGRASLSLGSRPPAGNNNNRSFPGWIDEARFYTDVGNDAFIESIRQSSTPVVVGNLAPDGSLLQAGTNVLTFTATSANGVNTSGVQVLVNGADVSSSLSFTATTGGQIVTYTNLPVNPTMLSQANLNGVKVAIKVTDAGGIITSNLYFYDAFSPVNFTWEAEDYDYSSGLFTDNPTYVFDPTINPYYQSAGTPQTDYQDNGNGTGSPQSQVYRSSSDLAATEYSLGAGTSGNAPGNISLGELMRQKILSAYNQTNIIRDVDLGNFDFGASTTPGLPNWVNYTRTYPQGLYNVYLRAAMGNASGLATLSQITSGWGTFNQTSNVLGTFTLANFGGWESYSWIPLKDQYGNLVQVNVAGTNTLRLTAGSGGGGNVNFLMFVPANTNLPVINSIYPNQTNLFQNASALTFNVSSPAGIAISTNSISVRLAVTNYFLGLNFSFVTNITATNGLTFSGSSTSWNVSYLLTSNAIYSASITAFDVNGSPANSFVAFDTFNPSYIFEAEDYNYGNGQTYDNSGTINQYAGAAGTDGVDFHNVTATGEQWTYRPQGGALGDQATADVPRLAYLTNSLIDYNIGWFNGGDWGNYTRTFPAGKYNIYVRAANGNGSAVVATVSSVSGDITTTSQTNTTLGQVTIPPTGAWANYTWLPVRDGSGNMVQFTGGSLQTLRVTSGGAYNANFYALLPANTNLPAIGSVNPAPGLIYQSTNTLAFNVAATGGVTTNNIVVRLNGVVLTNLIFTGTANNWAVSYTHLQPNTSYTLSVTATDANGRAVLYNSTFDTFSTVNYTWEAEDADHDGGLFFDNPQTNAYFGLGAITNIDTYQSNTNGTYLYLTNGIHTEITSDAVRPPYAGTGMTDYDLSFFSSGSWVNYTRNFPAGSYNVYGRMATGAATNAIVRLSVVTSGWGTTTQTTNFLGSFTVGTNASASYQSFAFYPLNDVSGKLATIQFNGSTNTLQISRPGAPDVNVNFLMLVPAFIANASKQGANVVMSFPAQTGFNYQVQYKTNLTDSVWSPLGSVVQGTNGTVNVSDPAQVNTRFYRIQVQ